MRESGVRRGQEPKVRNNTNAELTTGNVSEWEKGNGRETSLPGNTIRMQLHKEQGA